MVLVWAWAASRVWIVVVQQASRVGLFVGGELRGLVQELVWAVMGVG